MSDLNVAAPVVAAIVTALAILVVDLVAPGRTAAAVATALGGLAITAAITLAVGSGAPATAFGTADAPMYRLDALTTFLDLLFIAIIALTLVFAPDYLAPRGLPMAEFAVVLMFAMTGAMLIAASTDLLPVSYTHLTLPTICSV